MSRHVTMRPSSSEARRIRRRARGIWSASSSSAAERTGLGEEDRVQAGMALGRGQHQEQGEGDPPQAVRELPRDSDPHVRVLAHAHVGPLFVPRTAEIQGRALSVGHLCGVRRALYVRVLRRDQRQDV